MIQGRSLFLVLASGLLMLLPAPVSGEEVPKGEVVHFVFDRSQIFPGTVRECWIYVPRQYDPAKPACLYVNQDGIQYKAPAVFDELIHKKEMPITIGVFVMHGRVKALSPQALDRFNRSFEYDGLGDNYARFLIEELLPEVERKSTSDGRPIRLSRDPNDRAIGGSSSGAVCAFTAAWERPDAFRRVFSSIGTYVGLRGANDYPTLIRKTEPKPIRVFLQDGSNDLNIYGGDWWMANQEMERALTFAGYEVNHIWGTGGHDHKQADQIFPDAMSWLWKDWPAPVKAGAGSKQLQEILIPGEDWTLVAEGYRFTEGPAPSAAGEVIFNDIPASKAYKIGTRRKGLAVSRPDQRSKRPGLRSGWPIVCRRPPVPARFSPTAQVARLTVIADGIRGNDLVVRHDGSLYVTNPGAGDREPSKVWYISPKGEKRVVDTGLKYANGVAALAGSVAPLCGRLPQSLGLQLPDPARWITRAQAEILITCTCPTPLTTPAPTACGSTARDGCTWPRGMGIQVCDQAGRVNCDHPHAQRQDREPLLRRTAIRHSLRHLRRQGLQAKGEGPGGECVRRTAQAPDAAAMKRRST